MPLYEYLCKSCSHRFERIVKFSDAPLKTCPKCGKDTVEQLISAPAVQFKGSGWYVTDYARKNSSTGSAAPAKSESHSESTSSSNGDGAATKTSAEKAPSNTPAATSSPAGSGSASPAKA